MPDSKFRTATVAMVPDADPARHRSVVETSIYSLTTVLVRDEEDAVTVCRNLVTEGIRSFLLCPGFTNKGVAKISEAVGDGISVNVARGDHPGNEAARRAMVEAGFFDRRP